MGISQNIGTPFKNTWDVFVAQGYGKPDTRRLPYDDYGLITIAAVTGSGVAQAVATLLPMTPPPVACWPATSYSWSSASATRST